ncbi:hypothetical protein GYA28_00990 [Candidatus Roizmanbacteria bacterium]|nr:hypothetical protein [Candidatus Roizmanbacteria bacterium]
MKKFSCLFLLMIFLGVFPVAAQAKLLPRFSTSRSTGKTYSSGVGVSARLRADHQALNVYFSNLQKAASVMYTLVYEANSKEEGVSGSIDISSGNASRELLFGTCSTNNVCTYHQNITNMRFEVTTELTNGKKTLKRFRIRV